MTAASDPRTAARRATANAGERLDELPDPPAGLSEAAQRAWWDVGRIAVALGTVTAGDLPALTLLARCLGSESEAAAVLKRDGLTVTSSSGATKAHPALTALGQARAQGLAGTLRSGAGPDGTATTLRYRARVTAVRPAGEPGLLEVEARFEDLGFGVPATGDTPGPPLGARGGLLAGLAAFVPLLG